MTKRITIAKPPRKKLRSGFHKPTRVEEDKSKRHPRQAKYKKRIVPVDSVSQH